MSTLAKLFCFLAVVGWIGLATGPIASAQAPVVVSTYYAPQPVVANVPVRYGFFGRRLVMRPRVVYAAPVAPVRVTNYYAPAPVVAPTTVYYAPAAPLYYRPLPTPTYWRP